LARLSGDKWLGMRAGAGVLVLVFRNTTIQKLAAMTCRVWSFCYGVLQIGKHRQDLDSLDD
jgi:hypothetical protein